MELACFLVDFPELINGPVSLKQDDPNLVRFVRQNYLKNPINPASDVRYFVRGSSKASNYKSVKSRGQSKRYLTEVKYSQNWVFLTANGFL